MIDRLWLAAFVLTVAIEVPLVVALAPRGHRRLAAAIAVTVQMLTHPLAWLAVVGAHFGWWTVEAVVVVVEAVVYGFALGRPRRAFAASLLANAASACAGVLLLTP